jgi:hypothetical protein
VRRSGWPLGRQTTPPRSKTQLGVSSCGGKRKFGACETGSWPSLNHFHHAVRWHQRRSGSRSGTGCIDEALLDPETRYSLWRRLRSLVLSDALGGPTITSGWATIRELIGLVNTGAFVGTNPTDESITSGLSVTRAQLRSSSAR